MIKNIGKPDTGTKESQGGILDINAGGNTVAKAFSGGVYSDYFVTNPSTISTTAEIKTGYNAVAAGPITVTGTLTINGTLTIL
jgi:hypothetical protein